MNEIINAVKEAAQSAAEQMTGTVRDSARMAGWPASIARTLTVDAVDTGFQWTGHEDYMDWEFGTASRPPAPALRSFAHSKDPDRIFLTEVEAVLKKRGIL